jgi:hypothetical protein
MSTSEASKFCGGTFNFDHEWEADRAIRFLIDEGCTIISKTLVEYTMDSGLENVRWEVKVSNRKPRKARSAPVTRRNRQTGFEVTVGHAHDVGLEFEQGEVHWYSICEEHGSCLGHRTRRLAEEWAALPWGWCEFCADEYEAMS